MRAAVVALLVLFTGAAAAAPAPIYTDAVAKSDRSAADRERDARERSAEVLAFAGFKPGMTVADVFGAGGYYSELVANVVGPSGKVLLVNNGPYVAYAGDDMKKRFEKGRLPNVERSVVESCNLLLGENTLDAAMIVMSYHDLYHADPKGGWPPIDAANFLRQIHGALKPGGAFLIVDHSAKANTGKSAAQELHRIDEAFAKKDIASHGFVLESTYDGLRNPADDRGVLVFDPKIRGKTDRFVHLYRKKG
ncbi:MAG: class I SAM-dependent methyltransferase [Steroidobacteraceae bacterium]